MSTLARIKSGWIRGTEPTHIFSFTSRKNRVKHTSTRDTKLARVCSLCVTCIAQFGGEKIEATGAASAVFSTPPDLINDPPSLICRCYFISVRTASLPLRPSSFFVDSGSFLISDCTLLSNAENFTEALLFGCFFFARNDGRENWCALKFAWSHFLAWELGCKGINEGRRISLLNVMFSMFSRAASVIGACKI